MRLVLLLIVLACSLGANSIPITGSINQSFGGIDNTSISGPGLSFFIGNITQGCDFCGNPGGDCIPGTICGFNYSTTIEGFFGQPTDQFGTFTYQGMSPGPGIAGSVLAKFNLSTTGELFTDQPTLTEPVSLSGELEAWVGSGPFLGSPLLDLQVDGSGTAQVLFAVGGDPNSVFGIDVTFTGTASPSVVPEPKSTAFVIIIVVGVLAFLKIALRLDAA